MRCTLFLFFILSFCGFYSNAQIDSIFKKDTTPKRVAFKKPDIHKADSVKLQPAPDTLKNAITDSVKLYDSLQAAVADSLKKDSINKAQSVLFEGRKKDTSTYAAYLNHPFLPFGKPVLYMLMQEKIPDNKDALFYLLCGIVFLVALFRVLFPKYFNNTFTLFFQTSFRQRHTKDQMMQYNLASLLMNVLFLVSGSVYIHQLAWQLKLVQVNFWPLLLYSFILLTAVYLSKYLFLSFIGWVFNAKNVVRSYIFIVFTVNKILGIVLVPFILLMAFASGSFLQSIVTASLLVTAILFIYRYAVSLGTVRRDVKVSAFHFFLYLCSVEVLPILILYKVLFNIVANNN